MLLNITFDFLLLDFYYFFGGEDASGVKETSVWWGECERVHRAVFNKEAAPI